MNPDEALAELTELSAEIGAAAILDADANVLASTGDRDGETLARVARELLDVAAGVAPAGPAVAYVEVGLAEGSLFALRLTDCVAVATTVPEPASALVLYDLRTCLRRIAEPPQPARRRRATAKAATSAAEKKTGA